MTTETDPLAELRQTAVRAIHALKSPPPPGSQHYQSGWGTGLEAAIEAVQAVFDQAPATVARRILGTTEQADTETAPGVEAHPTLTEWIGEVQEGDGAWMFLGENSDRAFIEKRVANHHKRFSLWADGTPVNRRIVRKTTTYTVADEAQQPTPAVVSEYPTFGDIARTIHTKHPTTEHCEHDGEPWPCRVIRVTTAVYEQPTPAPAEETKPEAVVERPETDEEREQREDREETERLHAAGDHRYCDITCEPGYPSDMLRNGILCRAIPGSPAMLDELLRRAATPAP